MDSCYKYFQYQKEVAQAKLKILDSLQRGEKAAPNKRTSNESFEFFPKWIKSLLANNFRQKWSAILLLDLYINKIV